MAGYLFEKGLHVLQNGYNVIPILPGDKAPSVKNWQGKLTDENTIKQWMANGRADHGVGITTEYTPLVDLDILDKSVLKELIEDIEFYLGRAPVRVGFAPKRGLLFRSIEPFRKITSKQFIDSEGRRAQVEILGQGQQFVAYHIHPDTKKPYRWIGDANPENTPVENLLILTRDNGEWIKGRFEEIARARGWQEKRSSSSLPATTAVTLSAEDDPFGIGTDPLGLTEEEIREKVMVIPNDDIDYDEWLKFGFAIHHETDGSEFGRELFLDWSEQSSKHSDAKFDKSWKSFGQRNGDYRGVTFRYILKLAKEFEVAKKAEQVVELLRRFDFANSADEVREIAAECRRLDVDLIDRSRLVNALQAAVKSTSNVSLGVREARDMVKYRPDEKDTAADWLQNWVYLTQGDRFYNTEDRRMLVKPAFDAAFGRFLPGDATYTPSFFALNRAKIPVYHLAVYLPNSDKTFTLNGQECINLYSDALVPAIPAKLTDSDRWAIGVVEQHFRNLCNNERDMGIIISWLSHLSKTRERPNWALIIQGPGGDGKSLIGMLMSAILGHNNYYTVAAETVESSFNAWSHGHLLAVIEEISGQKWNVLNRLKTIIANPVNELHQKGKDPINVPNTQAYVAFTNHRDALPVSDDDRRYFVQMSRFRDSQQLLEFLADKPNYFSDLVEAIEKHAGALRGWLDSWPAHPDFNAKGRAPDSHGRSQMAALNRSDEVDHFAEILASGERRDICDEIVLVSALTEALYGDMTSPKAVGRVLKKLLANAGFDYLGRVRVEGVQESVWSRRPDVWGKTIHGKGPDIKRWIDDEL